VKIRTSPTAEEEIQRKGNKKEKYIERIENNMGIVMPICLPLVDLQLDQ
jgi:hypothetical protein